MTRFRLVVGLTLLAAFQLAAAQQFDLLAVSGKPDTLLVSHPATYATIDQRAFATALGVGDRQTINVPMVLPDLGAVTLEVERFRVFAPDAVIQAMTDRGPVPIAKQQSILLRGSIKGVSGSHVMLACHQDYAVGYIDVKSADGRRRLLISPTAFPDKRVTMIVYDERFAAHPQPWLCGTDDSRSTPVDERRGKGTEGTQSTLRRIEMVLEGDFTYYQDHGSNVTVATNYAEDVIAACSDVYERDVAATLFITRWNVWTVNDPWPGVNTSDLLVQFRDWGRANLGAVNRSIVHMLSGVNNIGGIAYLDVLCNKNAGYAVDGLNNNIVYPRAGYVWDTDVTSHELGHNVGSPHTHSCAWAPPIDSCVTAEGTCYAGTKPVKGTIMSYCHLTAAGTNLEFHPRVQTLMRNELAAASACVPLISNLTVNAGRDTTVCPSTPAQLRATTSGGTAPFTYSWTPVATLVNPTTATPTATPSRTTDYVCTVTDAMGMVRRDTVRAIVNARMVLSNVPSVMICDGDSVVLDPSITSCGTGSITYTWAPADGLRSTTSKRIVAAPSNTTAYTCTAVHDCGDTARITVSVGVYERPRVILPSDLSICRGASLPVAAQIIRGVQPYTLEWSVNGEADQSMMGPVIDIQPDSSTTLILKAIDANGCVGYDTMSITVHQPPVVSLPPVEAVCAGAELSVKASITGGQPPYSIVWNGGRNDVGRADSNVTFRAIASGSLRCIVTDARGCSDTATTPLKVRSLDVAMSPNRVSIPELEACQDTMTHTVEFRNISTDTIRIVAITATWLLPSTRLPIIIPPGTATGVTIRTVVPIEAQDRDTIRFFDEFCARTYLLPVAGSRKTLRTTTTPVINLAPMSACDSVIERRHTLSLRNQTLKAIVIRSVAMLRTPGLAVVTTLPLAIPSNATVDVPLTIRGVFPAGDFMDSVVFNYTSPSCQGSLGIPIRTFVAPFELGAPESIDFGLGQFTETISRTVTLTPDLTGLSQLTVTRVALTGPFQTDLAVGATLRPGKPSTVTVAFVASKASKEGSQEGTLAFDIDGCPASTSIALRAETPVSVDEEASTATVRYDASSSAIIVNEPAATQIRIVDLLGRVLTMAPDTPVTRITMTTRGTVFVIVSTPVGEYMRPILIR